MANILITGGAGNLGSSLARTLVRNAEYKIVVADNLVTGNIRNLPSGFDNFSFFECDVNESEQLSALMLATKFDFIFHYAALVGVKRTLDNPLLVLKDIEGIKNILALAKNTGVKRVFYSSSSEVYGEPTIIPQHENTTPLNCRLPYAIVKNVGEAFFRSYQKEYGLDYNIFRFFNTYGPNQSVDFVISKFIDAALHDRDITIYGDGGQSRTFCYVDDNVDTIVKIFEGSLYVNDVVNIGNTVEISIQELAGIIISLTRSLSSIIHLPALKEGDMSRRQPDNTKMMGIINRPLVSIEQGIKNVLAARYNFVC
ncbi:NAD-dependent epimerase/dehydratase family protein [Pedobacter hartonius]|uniref:UDP-glucose 4-epimerase n=1 Tax=Pedobacter hartonius TaxID=425514 RepID=A0A1H4GB61_9SPHI|nr:NAD-dependent epimerase/dehydratase family protein [Pedobacter hartonius]SEB06883.1 UDP-glucose 4-epimerase [Pedobacter hartonius]